MPQRDLLLPWLSALDNAGLALRISGVPRQEARARAGEHFGRLGLSGFERARPDELSGGMRQRVAFLPTLMAGRPVLLLDEPFASLDAITRGEMQSWLAGVLGPDRHTVVLVTHDVEEALYLSDRVLVLSSRPARVADRIEIAAPRAADRAASVTSHGFAELKERALRSLAEAAG
jgi:NitT/TauT family transport system ATP-binding protein